MRTRQQGADVVREESRARSDLALAVHAARGAGAIVRNGFGQTHTIDYKSADQPVTAVDLEADRFLHATLLQSRPGYGWLSEESRVEAAIGSAPTWVVDPLDGTSNFLEGRPEFAICIGLVERGTPVLGVVYNPMSDTLFSAIRGGPACRDDVPVQATAWPAEAPELVVSWAELHAGRLGSFAPGWKLSTLGSTSLKMMRVAEGSADAYVSVGPKGVWDLCAGVVIAHAAGATVATLSGEPLPPLDRPGQITGLIVVGRAGEAAIGRISQLAQANPD